MEMTTKEYAVCLEIPRHPCDFIAWTLLTPRTTPNGSSRCSSGQLGHFISLEEMGFVKFGLQVCHWMPCAHIYPRFAAVLDHLPFQLVTSVMYVFFLVDCCVFLGTAPFNCCQVHWGPTTPLAFQTVTAPIQLLEAISRSGKTRQDKTFFLR